MKSSMALKRLCCFLCRKLGGRGRKRKIASTLRKMAQIRNTCERPYAIIGIGGTGKKMHEKDILLHGAVVFCYHQYILREKNHEY